MGLVRLDTLRAATGSMEQPDATDTWAMNRLRAQRAWLAQPECPHTADLGGPHQVIHGDYHDGNLFFDRGSVSGVIDWEQAAWMPRTFEAVRRTC